MEKFQEGNEWSRNFLENLALECTRELLLDYNKNFSEENNNNNNPGEHRIDVEKVIDYHSELNYSMPEGKFFPSPYDLFFYNNEVYSFDHLQQFCSQ